MSFLVAAYIISWLVLFGYLLFLKQRESQLRRELNTLRKQKQS